MLILGISPTLSNQGGCKPYPKQEFEWFFQAMLKQIRLRALATEPLEE